MSTEVKIIADSVSLVGKRITTFQLRYPRSIHAELMTHRMFSRNASSTRAISLSKQIQDVIEDPYMPVHWGKNQSGMQADEQLSIAEVEIAKTHWLEARNQVINHVKQLQKLGLHKQISGRLLEPWAHINVIVTATEWDNWYVLRTDSKAHPDIQVLANKMLDAHNINIPRLLTDNQWHLPYVTEEERKFLEQEEQLKCSVARCARVSYKNHDKSDPLIEKDIELYEKLLQSKHMSAFEHQAFAANPTIIINSITGNFTGWVQYRKTIPNEHCQHFERLLKV